MEALKEKTETLQRGRPKRPDAGRAGPQIDREMEKIAQWGSALFLASIFGNGLNYFFGIFIARALGPAQFGLYVLGLAIFNILVMMAPLGLEVGVLKFVSRQLALGETASARRTIVQALLFTLLSGTATGLGLYFLAGMISLSVYQKAGFATVLPYFAAAVPLASAGAVLLASLQAFQRVRDTVLIKYLWEPAGKFLLAALFLSAGFGLSGVLTAIVLVFAVSLLAALRSLNRVEQFAGRRNLPPIDRNGRALLLFCFPLVVSNLFGVVAPRSDLLILGYSVPSAELGVYSAAFQTAAIFALVLGAFDQSFAPLIGGLLAGEERQGLEKLYQAVTRWTLIVIFPIFLLMVIFGADLLSIFGENFSVGTGCLVLLAAAQLLSATTGSAATILLMSGHSKKIMWNSIGFGLFLIVANLLLVPRFGMFGAAVSMSACLIFGAAVRGAQVWRLHRVQPFSRNLLKPLGAGLLAAGIVWSSRALWELSVFQVLPAACLLYVFFLYIFKLEEADFSILRFLVGKVMRSSGFLTR